MEHSYNIKLVLSKNGGIIMQQNFTKTTNEIISMEEYLVKRQAIKEQEKKKENKNVIMLKNSNPSHLFWEV